MAAALAGPIPVRESSCSSEAVLMFRGGGSKRVVIANNSNNTDIALDTPSLAEECIPL